MDGKNGIKITNYWSCVNGRSVESDSSSDNQDELPSSSSSSSSSPPTPPPAPQLQVGALRRRQLAMASNLHNGPSTSSAADTSIRAADSTSALTTISTATSTSGHHNALNMLSSSSSSWSDSEGPADSTVTSTNVGLTISTNIYEDDDDDDEDEIEEQGIDMELTDEDNDSTTVEGSHSFDLTDMILGTMGVDISPSFQFNQFDEDFQLAYEFLESDGLLGVEDKENDQPSY